MINSLFQRVGTSCLREKGSFEFKPECLKYVVSFFIFARAPLVIGHSLEKSNIVLAGYGFPRIFFS